MSDESNTKFSMPFKKYDESKVYDKFVEEIIEFDSAELVLDSITDIYKIMAEINTISAKGFKYGTLCDAQNRVVQQIEDEFEKWKATTYHKNGIDDKAYKTEKAKERFLMVNYAEEYAKFQQAVSVEKYHLDLLKRTVKSLESYAYKLHDLKGYNLAIEKHV